MSPRARTTLIGLGGAAIEAALGGWLALGPGAGRIAAFMLVCALVTVALSALLWFALAPRGGGGGSGGLGSTRGGGDGEPGGGPRPGGDDDPPWWPEFERALNDYQRGREHEPA